MFVNRFYVDHLKPIREIPRNTYLGCTHAPKPFLACKGRFDVQYVAQFLAAGWHGVFLVGVCFAGWARFFPWAKSRLAKASANRFLPTFLEDPWNNFAGQDEILAPILSQIKNGFFVESGAYDGEDQSNTIYYESLGWQGLLVEPGRAYFKIATKKRKAWVFHGAISPSKGSMQLNFTDRKEGRLSHQDETSSRQVQAEPLEKLIRAIDSDRRTVDFWSLDIEGYECKVLESTDFQKLQVGILLVEMNKTPENNACIRSVMERNGFQDIGKTQDDIERPDKRHRVIDHVFINQQYVQKRGLSLPKHLHGLHWDSNRPILLDSPWRFESQFWALWFW